MSVNYQILALIVHMVSFHYRLVLQLIHVCLNQKIIILLVTLQDINWLVLLIIPNYRGMLIHSVLVHLLQILLQVVIVALITLLEYLIVVTHTNLQEVLEQLLIFINSELDIGL